jgi:inosine-uridine nucleoside N-ribohydrolase
MPLSSCKKEQNNSNQQETNLMSDKGNKIPVILDTDIGADIDDLWALILLLNSPEFDVKLIVSSTGDTVARAQIIAKTLALANRTDIPIGIGVPDNRMKNYMLSWAADYDLKSYPGTVYPDGVKALIDTINKSPGTITLIDIGPLPNIAAALDRDPGIAVKVDFFGMYGSIRSGYAGQAEVQPEYNVKCCLPESQKTFTAPWKSMTITPLDTCGVVVLEGEKYQKILKHDSPMMKALIEAYRIWITNPELPLETIDNMADIKSSTLYDTVAIYLPLSTKMVKMEMLGIRVDEQGCTRIDANAKKVNCATAWKDLAGFEDFLVERLTK